MTGSALPHAPTNTLAAVVTTAAPETRQETQFSASKVLARLGFRALPWLEHVADNPSESSFAMGCLWAFNALPLTTSIAVAVVGLLIWLYLVDWISVVGLWHGWVLPYSASLDVAVSDDPIRR